MASNAIEGRQILFLRPTGRIGLSVSAVFVCHCGAQGLGRRQCAQRETPDPIDGRKGLDLRPLGSNQLHSLRGQFVLYEMVPAAGMGVLKGLLNHDFHGRSEDTLEFLKLRLREGPCIS